MSTTNTMQSQDAPVIPNPSRMGDSTRDYEVLQRGPNDSASEIVLCDRGKDTPQRFVVWTRCLRDGSTYWGHYFDDIVEAAQTFAEKTGRNV